MLTYSLRRFLVDIPAGDSFAMPNRILREGICKSDDINSLTAEQ